MKKFSWLSSFSGGTLGIIFMAFMLFTACSKDPGTKIVPITPVPPTETKTVPSVPPNVVATPDNKTVTVSAGTPSDGGSTITGYTVQVIKYETKWVGTGYTVLSTSVAKTVTVPSLPTIVDGLTNMATYKVVVKANNAVGSSAPSDSVGFIPMLPITKAFCSAPVVLQKRQTLVNGVYVDQPANPGFELIKYTFFPNGKYQVNILPGNPLYVGLDTAKISSTRGDWSIDDQNNFVFKLNAVNPTLTIEGDTFVYAYKFDVDTWREIYVKYK